MGPAFVETLPVAAFHGVGPVTARKMQALGLHTGADLRSTSLDFLSQRISAGQGRFTTAIARAEDARPAAPTARPVDRR